jgi:hypothetical protein
MKMKGVATEAQSVLDQADKALGSHPPLMVQGMYHGLVAAAMAPVDYANSTENDAVVLVYQNSVYEAAMPKAAGW